VNEYLEEDSKNIVYSLYRIAVFIRQKRLEDKTAKNISQIAEFGYVVWNFISSIYKLEWDILAANKDNKSFKLYISVQFKLKVPMNNIGNNKDLSKLGKKANISRVPSLSLQD